jgi:hypothetical protein
VDRTWIDKYASGASVPTESIAGLSDSELSAFPIPGTWSIRQIILHLMDSDLVGSDRMKRVIAEDSPTLLAYNETAFANRLFYDQLDVRMACEVFRLNRLMTANILRRLPEAAFARSGNHTERGHETLADLVQDYAEHLDHHMRFLKDKRRILGKPLA